MDAAKKLALGRLFRICSRPFQDGDVQEYYRCRDILMMGDAEPALDARPNFVRDRLNGAQGD
jgi:hypothetical protein